MEIEQKQGIVLGSDERNSNLDQPEHEDLTTLALKW